MKRVFAANLIGTSASRLALMAVCTLGVLLLATAGWTKQIGEHGGHGGKTFKSFCRPAQAMIGINMRSGSALDAVVPICIALDGQRREWVGQAYEPTPYVGGPGGGYQKIACEPGYVVKSMTVHAGPWDDLLVVKHISIVCRDLKSTREYTVAPRQKGGTVTSTRTLTCDRERIAAGLYGRAGSMIDRIGLNCLI